MDANRQDTARRIIRAVMRSMKDDIDADSRINVTRAAEAAGMSKSTFYRWLEADPRKYDVIGVSAVCQLLHDEYGKGDFMARWLRAEESVQSEEREREHVDVADAAGLV